MGSRGCARAALPAPVGRSRGAGAGGAWPCAPRAVGAGGCTGRPGVPVAARSQATRRLRLPSGGHRASAPLCPPALPAPGPAWPRLAAVGGSTRCRWVPGASCQLPLALPSRGRVAHRVPTPASCPIPGPDPHPDPDPTSPKPCWKGAGCFARAAPARGSPGPSRGGPVCPAVPLTWAAPRLGGSWVTGLTAWPPPAASALFPPGRLCLKGQEAPQVSAGVCWGHLEKSPPFPSTGRLRALVSQWEGRGSSPLDPVGRLRVQPERPRYMGCTWGCLGGVRAIYAAECGQGW